MNFVANCTHFPAVQKFWKSVKRWQSYTEFKGRNFFETQCISIKHAWRSFWMSNFWRTRFCTLFVIKRCFTVPKTTELCQKYLKETSKNLRCVILTGQLGAKCWASEEIWCFVLRHCRSEIQQNHGNKWRWMV